MTALLNVALKNLIESPFNPRKHYDKEKLAELAEGLKAHGVQQPLVVRPARAEGHVLPGKYELIFGHRRLRAAELAKLDEVPVIVNDVGDDLAAVLQITENDQREDLTALERAEGYQLLHEKHGLTVEAIAKEVKKSRAFVYGCLKLTELADAGKKALREGKLSASSAELIARVPLSLQGEVLEAALDDPGNMGIEPTPMGFRDLKDLIRTEYMLDLKKAPFDMKDAVLCPAAGACVACPKRTGAQSNLFGGEKISADICTDRTCFDEKKEEHKRREVAKAKEAGADVLTAAESKSALNTGYNAKYVQLEQGHHNALGKDKTWGDALKGTKLEPKLAMTPDGKLVEVALKEDVKAALKEKGSKLAKSAALDVEEPYQSKPYVPDPKVLLREKVVPTAIFLVVEKLEKAGELPRALTVMLAQHLWETCGTRAMMDRRGWELLAGKAAADRIAHLPEKQLTALIFEAAFADYFNETHRGYDHRLTEACKVLGIDLKKVEKEIADSEKLKAAAAAEVAAKSELEAKVAKVEAGTKLTPHQKKALISGLKSKAKSALPDVVKVPTKKLKPKAAKKPKAPKKAKPAKKGKAKR